MRNEEQRPGTPDGGARRRHPVRLCRRHHRVDGDPSKDVRILQDKTNIKAVVSRGQNIDIISELPRRSRIPGEKVSSWAGEVLTYDIAMGR